MLTIAPSGYMCGDSIISEAYADLDLASSIPGYLRVVHGVEGGGKSSFQEGVSEAQRLFEEWGRFPYRRDEEGEGVS
jgi:hypothetical protein